MLLAVFGWHLRHGPWSPLRIAGAAVLLLAFVLVSIARYQLGRSFSLTPQAHQLVTSGLYRVFRNPIYVFAELAFVGFAMMIPSWWPIVVMVAVIPLQVARARKETAVLEAAFGEEYRRYRARTWF